MRPLSVSVLLFVLLSVSSALAQRAETVRGYISKYKSIALQFEKEYGIPASITLAQSILESGAGTSSLTRASNNHFCIKAGISWTGRVYLAWDDEKTKSRFRCYDSAESSFRDYAQLLSTSKYYRNLFSFSVYDYRSWAYGLKKAGYATAPNYAQALIGIIDQYKLYTINGGVKLRPGKTVIITKYIEQEKPVFDESCVIPEDEETDEQRIIVEATQRYAVEINNIHCTVVQPGETLASVSRKHDISPIDLLKYNELESEYQVEAGDIIFLNKKKKKYDGAQDVYWATGGETLYEVSQKFGIQLHRLAKMNDLNDYVRLREGTRIRLK